MHVRIRKTALILAVILPLYGFFGCKEEENRSPFVDEPPEVVLMENEEDEKEIIVEIKGNVKNPGVYAMKSGVRLNDLLILSGGALPEASLRQVNLAMRIADGESFYIPSEEDEAEGPVSVGTSIEDGKIDLNSATREQLMTVNGIGPSTADNIIAYRDEHGKFKSVEDLIHVNRIGEKTLEKLRDSFIVR